MLARFSIEPLVPAWLVHLLLPQILTRMAVLAF
jgi:hypothetical protein